MSALKDPPATYANRVLRAALAPLARRAIPCAPLTIARMTIAPIARVAAWGPLGLVLVAGAGLRLWLLGRDVPTLNSDEAVIGLMGLHVLHGEWSVFYWGQDYMGSLEAVVAAPSLALFGASAFALRLATLLLSLVFVVTSYALAGRLYSRGVALATATALALGPPFLVVLGLRAWGGYIETLIFGNLLLLLALPLPAPPRRLAPRAALLGLVAGLALYTHLLVLPYLGGVALLAFWQRRRDMLGRGALLAGAAGMLVALAPAIVANVFSGGGTVVQILRLTVLAPGGAPTLPLLPRNVWLLLSASLPILVGAGYGGLQADGYTPRDFTAASAAQPAGYAISILLAALAAALVVGAAASALRGWRSLRAPAAVPGAVPVIDARRLRRQGRAALALVGAAYLLAFCFAKQEEIFVMPRYLLPLYALTPLCLGRAHELLHHFLGRPTAGGPRRAMLRAVAVLVVALVVGWNVGADAALTPLQTAAHGHGAWLGGQDRELLALLRARRVHTVISNEYWLGLKLTFESGETIIAVLRGPDGAPNYNRYRPYVARGLADPRPAYVEVAGSREAEQYVARLHAGDLPGYTVATVGGYTVVAPG